MLAGRARVLAPRTNEVNARAALRALARVRLRVAAPPLRRLRRRGGRWGRGGLGGGGGARGAL